MGSGKDNTQRAWVPFTQLLPVTSYSNHYSILRFDEFA